MVDSCLLSTSFQKITSAFQKYGWPKTVIITGFQFSQKKRWVYQFIKNEILANNTSSLSQEQIIQFLEQEKHPDAILFSQKSRIKIGNKDEEHTIRHMQKEVFSFAPKYGTKRFILFEHAELFTEQAESSLLKVLEEPPPNTFFILLAPRAIDLKKTIQSRAIKLYFRDVSNYKNNDTIPTWNNIWMTLGYQELELFQDFEKQKLKQQVEDLYNQLSLSSKDLLLFDTLFFEIIHKNILESKYIFTEKQQLIKFVIMPLIIILKNSIPKVQNQHSLHFINLKFTNYKVIYTLLGAFERFQKKQNQMYYGSIPVSLQFITVLLFQEIIQHWPVSSYSNH